MNQNWRLKGACPAYLVETGGEVSQAGYRGASEKWAGAGCVSRSARTRGTNERCLPSGERTLKAAEMGEDAESSI